MEGGSSVGGGRVLSQWGARSPGNKRPVNALREDVPWGEGCF
jgi:hypothetical protein